MKKHWVSFEGWFQGSVLVEGDETPEDAIKYVKRNVNISSEVETEDVEINVWECSNFSAEEAT